MQGKKERISDIMDDMRISGCLMILALRIRLRRGGGRCLGRRRKGIGWRRGTKEDELRGREIEMVERVLIGLESRCRSIQLHCLPTFFDSNLSAH